MAQRSVLITTSYLDRGGDIERLLRDAGHDVIFCRPQDRTDTGDLTRAITAASGIIAGNDRITADMLADAPDLTIIARTGVGYDSIDTFAADRYGITVCNTPGANQRSVAELTLGLILDCARGITATATETRSGSWRQVTGVELAGKTLGIIGLGAIGKSVASLAAAIGMQVVAFDPFPDEEFASGHGVGLRTLSELLGQADFVTIHVALTEQTHHLIRRDTLALMKPTAYLINTSRGGVIDETDLADALTTGALAGAALDVLDSEPPTPMHPLLHAPGVIITPHIAGATAEARALSSHTAADQVIAQLAGRDIPYVVNRPAPQVRTQAAGA